MVELLLGISLTINFLVGGVIYYIYRQAIRLIRVEEKHTKKSIGAITDFLKLFGEHQYKA